MPEPCESAAGSSRRPNHVGESRKISPPPAKRKRRRDPVPTFGRVTTPPIRLTRTERYLSAATCFAPRPHLLSAPVNQSNDTTAQHPSPGGASGRNPAAWRHALVLSFGLLAGLSWLLARLVFLPYYMGLFFYLVAGLLVSGATFRMARAARPISRARMSRGVIVVATLAWAVSIVWEYRDRVAGIATGARFVEAKNQAIAGGKSPSVVESKAIEMFHERLRTDYPPGGLLGYVRWVLRSGTMTVTVGPSTDELAISQRRAAWAARSVASIALFALGLWFGFESLRSPTPVTNLLAPGEEAEDEDD